VLIVILPAVCPVRRQPAVQFVGPIDGPHISEQCWRRLSIVQINVTLNVTPGRLTSTTNVTLGFQRSDGNV
jgi:hypothetical protein